MSAKYFIYLYQTFSLENFLSIKKPSLFLTSLQAISNTYTLLSPTDTIIIQDIFRYNFYSLLIILNGTFDKTYREIPKLLF